jgi:hypothetical protein
MNILINDDTGDFMTTVADIEKEVWKKMESAMSDKDSFALAILSEVAKNIEDRKREWEKSLEQLSSRDGDSPRHSGRTGNSPRTDAVVRNFTNQPIRAFSLNGSRIDVRTYKELLVKMSNILRRKHNGNFDQVALKLGGRKRVYYSRTAADLKYAEELENGGLFVETNLNANLIVNNICQPLVQALEPGSSFDVF